MSDGRAPFGRPPLLLQVCANDHPPFADICRYFGAAAATLGWETRTVMLAAHGRRREPDFHYADTASGFAACASGLLEPDEPVLALCHRYRAYRAAMTSRAVNAPVVALAHEFGFFRRRRRRWQRHWDRLRSRPPVAFAGVSDAVAGELARVTGHPVLLPNGIDLARSDANRAAREAALEALGLSSNAFNIGVVGRLHPKKNPRLAVAGLAAVAERMPDAVLTFVGDGELTRRVAADGRGLPVNLAGFVPDAARLMAAFDLLLIPSGGREAFGMAALEAMASAVPVLCGPSPGPRFVVGDAGLTFAADDPADLGEALLAAWREWRTGGLADLGRRGRARAEREFSVAAAAGRLDALALTQ